MGRISLGRCETATNVLSTDRQAIRIQKTGQAWSRRTLLHSSICQKTQLKSNNPLRPPLLMALAVRRNCQCIQAEFWQQFILSRPESTPYSRANTNYSTRCFLPSTVLYHIFCVLQSLRGGLAFDIRLSRAPRCASERRKHEAPKEDLAQQITHCSTDLLS